MNKTTLLLAFFCLVFAYVNADDKVRLNLYFESKCPDSRKFVNSQLYPTYQKLSSIINLRLVPFGNGNVSISRGGRTLTYSCQHGDDECWGNKYQECAGLFHHDKQLDLVNCMFASQNWRTPNQSAKECSQKLQLNHTVLSHCTDNAIGNRLLVADAADTVLLTPTHTGVPWVTVNGDGSSDIQNQANTNLTKLICQIYKGSQRPAQCQ